MLLRRETLMDEHRALEEVAAALLAEMDRPQPCLSRISALRWALARKLLAHLTKEDSLLYPRLMSGRDPSAADLARRFVDDMGGLAREYNEHIRHWTGPCIAADWAGYAAASRTLIDRLRQRIEREEAELYPLLFAGTRGAA